MDYCSADAGAGARCGQSLATAGFGEGSGGRCEWEKARRRDDAVCNKKNATRSRLSPGSRREQITLISSKCMSIGRFRAQRCSASNGVQRDEGSDDKNHSVRTQYFLSTWIGRCKVLDSLLQSYGETRKAKPVNTQVFCVIKTQDPVNMLLVVGCQLTYG